MSHLTRASAHTQHSFDGASALDTAEFDTAEFDTAGLDTAALSTTAHHTSSRNTSSRRSSWLRGRFVATLAAAAALTLGGLAAASPAYAHDELVGFALTPESADAAPQAPTGFVLQFNNELTDMGAEVLGHDAAGNSIVDGAPQLSGRELTQKFTPGLADGDYTITWNVVSSDGHRIAGALALQIAAGAPASLETTDLADAVATHTHGDANSAPTHEHAEPADVTTTPGWVTPVAIIGGIAVIGAVGVVLVRKFRAATPPTDRNGQNGGNA